MFQVIGILSLLGMVTVTSGRLRTQAGYQKEFSCIRLDVFSCSHGWRWPPSLRCRSRRSRSGQRPRRTPEAAPQGAPPAGGILTRDAVLRDPEIRRWAMQPRHHDCRVVRLSVPVLQKGRAGAGQDRQARRQDKVGLEGLAGCSGLSLPMRPRWRSPRSTRTSIRPRMMR